MSFVLDAQRRREEQADPDRAARAAYEQTATRRRHRLLLIVAVSILVLAAFSSWLVLRPAGQPEPVVATAEPVQPSETVEETSPPDIRPAVRVQARPKPPPPPPPERQPEVLTVNSASAAAQQTLLGFRYSSHIFGSDPGSRYIVVDDRRLQVGDSHGSWTLEIISEDGVVWRKDRERVSVPVLQMWESG